MLYKENISLMNCCLPVRDLRHLAPPQGLLAISGILKKMGFDYTLVNSAEAIPPDHLNTSSLADVLGGLNSNLVGLSVWDSVLPFVIPAIRLAKQRRPDLFVILGGPAASTVGPKAISEFPWIDCVVAGEGETGLPGVLSFLSGQFRTPHDLPAGVHLRRQGNVMSGKSPRTRLKGCRIAALDYTLFDFSKYGRFEVSTPRGCVHNCRFCSVNSAWGKGIRLRPMASVLGEIFRLVNTIKTDLIHVIDDSFLSSPDRVKAFCKGFQELRKDSKDLRFSCYARIDDLTPSMVDLLAKSGCAGLFTGLESSRLKDNSISLRGCLGLISELSRDFNVMASLIWGDPEESKADFETTLAVSAKLLDFSENVAVNLYQLAPLSGTFYAKHHRYEYYDSKNISEFVYPGYLPPLSADEEAEAMIRLHPEIFPAFYRVKTPFFHWKRQRVKEFLKDPWTGCHTGAISHGAAWS